MRTRFINVSLILPTYRRLLKRLLRQVCHPCTVFFRSIFYLKLRKKIIIKKQVKEGEIGRFQSRVTNNVSAKTSTKTKYQTSWGQNSYSSSLSFSALKLANLNKKDAETEWHTGVRSVCTIFFLNLGRFSSRLHYGTLDLYATFKIRSVMIYFVPFLCPAISKMLGLTHVVISKWVKSH